MFICPNQTMRICVAAALFATTCSASAGGVAAGVIKTTTGTVSIQRDDTLIPAQVGTVVMAQDKILTGTNSSVGIALKDDTLLAAGPGSVIALDRFAFNTSTYEGNMSLRILKGTLRAITGLISHQSPGSVAFSTPTSTLGIRGTDFIVDVP